MPRKDIGLAAIRARFGIDRSTRPRASKTAAIVCLVLLAYLAVAQVTHVHAIGSDADHCQLCVAMHSVVPFLVVGVAVRLVRIGTAALTHFEVRTICRNWHPTLFNRPPPPSC